MKLTDKNQVVLPINVYTASEDAACGILLEVGHEYLLAGWAQFNFSLQIIY
jgi:hypothetical protein